MVSVEAVPKLRVVAAQAGVDAGQVNVDGAVHQVTALDYVRNAVHG